MQYTIDGNTVNARTDWKHQFRPAEAPRREEGFPGVAQTFAVLGARVGDDLIVDGFLLGTGATVPLARASLISAINTWAALQSDGLEHEVGIDGVTFKHMQLLRCNSTGPVQRVAASGTVLLRQAVRFAWRSLRDELEFAAE